jgi:hypothetical protein
VNPKKPEGDMVVYEGVTIRKFLSLNSCLTLNILHPAYDIKLIMQRGVFDIVRPTWIKACVAKGELLPLSKKYELNRHPSHYADTLLSDTFSMLLRIPRTILPMMLTWKATFPLSLIRNLRKWTLI